jgi:NAD(P)-dependent dehydrogenase (short-subunit alcohol dehydrogenase family)
MYVTAVLFRSFSTKRCKSAALLKGKTVIVTGANTGIGLQITLELAKRHARVIMACRDSFRFVILTDEKDDKSNGLNTNVPCAVFDFTYSIALIAFDESRHAIITRA